MEENNKLSVERSRSIRTCIIDGYQLYMGNFYRIFRSSWLAAILYAVVSGIVTSYFIAEYPKLVILSAVGPTPSMADTSWVMPTVVALVVGFVVMLLASAYFTSFGVSVLREHKANGTITMPLKWFGRMDRPALMRTLKALGWTVVIEIIIGVIFGGLSYLTARFLSHYVALGVYLVVVLLAMLALLPLCYVFMKYLLTSGIGFFSLFASHYRTGLRRLGAIILVGLVVGYVTLMLMCVIGLPGIILYLANVSSQIGLLQGDAAGMPEYMRWLNLVVFTLAGFLMAYVSLSILFPFYYLCHKIDKEEEERQNQMQKLNNY